MERHSKTIYITKQYTLEERAEIFEKRSWNNDIVTSYLYRAMIMDFVIPISRKNGLSSIWLGKMGATCHTVRQTIDLL